MKRALRIMMSVAVSAIALSAAPASAQNLVANGGFESGSFSGWTRYGNPNDTFISGNAYTGAFAAAFGAAFIPGGMAQTIDTVIGREYTVSAFVRNLSGRTPNGFLFTFGAVPYAFAANAPAFPYTQVSFNRVATSTRTTLSFSFLHNPSRFLIDDISVRAVPVAAAVPEPATWGMMILGFGVVGAAMRRRRTVSAEVRFA